MQFSKWIIVASLLLSGCASTPPTQFYVLEPLDESAPATTGAVKKQLIGVGPLSIPALIDRQKIVTRTPANTIEIAAFH